MNTETRAAPTGRADARISLAIIISTITCASFVNALAVASRLAQTSDSANGFVVGHAVTRGNVLLSGWIFPLDDYYFTDVVPYALLEMLAGSQPFLLVLVPALTCALFVLITLLVCCGREKQPATNLVSGATVALLLGAPPWTGQWNPILMSGMHMATVSGAFAGIVLCARVARAGTASFMVAAGLVTITAVTTASDPFAPVFAFGPALAILAGDVVARPHLRGVWLAPALLGAGAMAGYLLPWAVALGGGFTTENDILIRPEALSLLPRNLTAVVMGTLTLSGANPLRDAAGFRDGVLLLLRGIGLVFAVVAVLRTMRHAVVRNPATLLDRMLCAGIVIVLAACILSAQFAKGITPENLWIGGPPMRFLVPAFLFAVVLAGRQAPEMLSAVSNSFIRDGLRPVLICIAATITFGGYWLARLDSQPVWIADNPPAAAARWLGRHGLSQGVGEYWSANVISAMSGNTVEVRSVRPSSGRLVPYVWVEDARSYAQAPQFVIWQDNNKTNVTADEIRATYSVRQIATVADYRIALLSSRSGNSTAQAVPAR